MKYYYQLVIDKKAHLLLIYDQKSVDTYINKVLKLKQDQVNTITGPGIVIEFDDERHFNPDLKLNKLADIDMSTDIYHIKEALNKSLSIEHIDIIENIIKVTYWKEFTVCSTELKMIIEILVDRYIKHIENEK